jgi:ATP-dependent HslUV protease ATP-binding subunit HslU
MLRFPLRNAHKRIVLNTHRVFSSNSTIDDQSDADAPPPPTDEHEHEHEPTADSDTHTGTDDIDIKTSKQVNKLHAHQTPSDIVKSLSEHIVGQQDAKRAVSLAIRNRIRRTFLPKELQKEVTPRNVLMIGPTGCGKTEIARRMADLSNAPFIKVEATKFTEVGYHGRDVDSIVRDLVEVGIQQMKKLKTKEIKGDAEEAVKERILDILTGPNRDKTSRESFRTLLESGGLDEQEIEVDVPVSTDKNAGIFAMGGDGAANNNPNVAAMNDFLSKVAGGGNGKKAPTERKKMTITEAKEVILDIEIESMLENIDLKKEAIAAVEQKGIVFLDEIDKICSSRDLMSKSADASAEGVQRDLLPLVEGTTISTKFGNINTDYILFIASGAFHSVKPSDMLPELQGRLPVRVELQGLSEDDLYRILTEPVVNVLRQQKELIATEGVDLIFEDDAIREIARLASELNRTIENIGARRLHTVIERIMEKISFEAAEMEEGEQIVVDKELVQERLSDFLVSSDLSRYIL